MAEDHVPAKQLTHAEVLPGLEDQDPLRQL
jgi:hypothetical protein